MTGLHDHGSATEPNRCSKIANDLVPDDAANHLVATDRTLVIVLEAGGGASSAWWALVQQALVPHVAVLAYGRAGLGCNAVDACRIDVSAEAYVERTHEMLSRLAGPGHTQRYLFVGHSLGGLYAQAYSSSYPDQVCGLVMVDHTLSPTGSSGLFRVTCAALRGLACIAMASARLRPSQRWTWTHAMALRLAGQLPLAARAEVIEVLSRPRHLATALREIGNLPSLLDWLHAHPLPESLPLLCVSAGRHGTGQAERPRSGIQLARRAAFAQHRAGARHVMLKRADHASLLTDPEQATLLADAVLQFAASLKEVAPEPVAPI